MKQDELQYLFPFTDWTQINVMHNRCTDIWLTYVKCKPSNHTNKTKWSMQRMWHQLRLSSNRCSCLSVILSTVWAEVNKLPGSLLPRASSALSVISAVRAAASSWKGIFCQESSNETWLICLFQWLHVVDERSLSDMTRWHSAKLEKTHLFWDWLGGRSSLAALQITFIHRLLKRGFFSQEVIERKASAERKRSRLPRGMAAMGALEIAWLITAAAALPCVVMAGAGRAHGQAESEWQRVFFLFHQVKTSEAAKLNLHFQIMNT